MKENLPKFLFVGTAKAGTTSIYNYLLQHPQIALPVKETFYFMRKAMEFNLPYPQQRDREGLILDEHEYRKAFTGNENRITGEIGTGYLYAYQESIPEIKRLLGEEVKVLMVLRNPVDRTFSSYKHFLKDLHETDTFRESLNSEHERIARHWDFMWHHTAVSRYCEQVKAYLNAFPKVKILWYDDLETDPQVFMRDIFNFIGVESNVPLELEKRVNVSGKAKNEQLQRFITQENALKRFLRPVIRQFLSFEQREKLRKGIKNRNMTRGDKLDPLDRYYLIQEFSAEIDCLAKLTGRDLSHWKH